MTNLQTREQLTEAMEENDRFDRNALRFLTVAEIGVAIWITYAIWKFFA